MPWRYLNSKTMRCSNCEVIPLVGPVETKLKLCYICIIARDRMLREWKAQDTTMTTNGVME